MGSDFIDETEDSGSVMPKPINWDAGYAWPNVQRIGEVVPHYPAEENSRGSRPAPITQQVDFIWETEDNTPPMPLELTVPPTLGEWADRKIADYTKQMEAAIANNSRFIVSAGSATPAEVRYANLTWYKEQIVANLQNSSNLHFGIIEYLLQIQKQELFRSDINPKTGKPFTSFSSFLPFILSEWSQAGYAGPTSLRQIYDYLRIYRLFILPGYVTQQQVVTTGITHFIALAEAAAYDADTYQLLDTVEAGMKKLPAAALLKVLSDTVEAKESGGDLTLSSTVAILDSGRGVVRPSVSLRLYRKPGSKTLMFQSISVFRGGVLSSSSVGGGLADKDAELLAQLLGTNLDIDEDE